MLALFDGVLAACFLAPLLLYLYLPIRGARPLQTVAFVPGITGRLYQQFAE